MLYYATYVIKSIKNLIKVKKKKKKHIKCNNPVVRRLAQQHLIPKSRQAHLVSVSQPWWLERNASQSYFLSGILTFFFFVKYKLSRKDYSWR